MESVADVDGVLFCNGTVVEEVQGVVFRQLLVGACCWSPCELHPGS